MYFFIKKHANYFIFNVSLPTVSNYLFLNYFTFDLLTIFMEYIIRIILVLVALWYGGSNEFFENSPRFTMQDLVFLTQ